jgi:hypothetical protein
MRGPGFRVLTSRFHLCNADVATHVALSILSLPAAFKEKDKAINALGKHMNSSLANSTDNQYYAAWTKFKAWLPLGTNIFNSQQCNSTAVALYFAELIDHQDHREAPPRGAPCQHGDSVAVAKTSRLSAIASSELEMAGSRTATLFETRLAACFA